MSTQKWEPGSLHPYPFTNDDLRIKTERQPIALEKEIVLKSQLLSRAQMESQTAEELFRTCCGMITQHGFLVSQDTFTAPSTDGNIQAAMYTALQSGNIRKTVEKSDLYRAYKSEQNAHPMRCADDIIRFMQELVAVRRELYFQYDGYQSGQDGEDAVMSYLEQLAEVDGHILCDNVVINKQVSGHIAQTSEIDTCVITERGIILCEIKNKFSRGAKRITISKAGRWEELDKKTNQFTVPQQSPIEQNNTHDRNLRKFLKNHGYGFVNTLPVIVIANTNVEVVNLSDNKIIYISELDNIFRNNQNPVCLTYEQMKDIACLLQGESETIEERAFPLATVSGIAESIKDTLVQLLEDFDQEKQWEQSNAEIILKATLQEKESAKRKKERKKRGCGCFIAALLVGVLALLIGWDALFNHNGLTHRPVEESLTIADWKREGTGIFANYFGDTIVLTTYPIDEYNGQNCTGTWTGVDKGCVDPYTYIGDNSEGEIKSVVILDDLYPLSTRGWFCGMVSLQTIVGFEKIHTENTVCTKDMFAGCTQLVNIDALSEWDVSNVTDMGGMFAYCANLKDVNSLLDWDVSSVTNMGGMFEHCTGLQNIDGLSDWNTASVQELSGMFWGCTELQHGDLSRWNTSNVFGTTGMFGDCVNLRTLGDLSNWDLSGLGRGDHQLGTPEEFMAGMFMNCHMLDAIPEWYKN